MQDNSVIITGAGASGLMAAYILSAAGYTVTLLEARDRIGGRIHTVRDPAFVPFADLGAEFIHGKLPETLGLMQAAGLKHHLTAGDMWQARNGNLTRDEHFIPHWQVLVRHLEALEEEMTVDAFLEKYLDGDEYAGLRSSVKKYAEGYDTADTARASMLALKDEWLHEDDSTTSRPDEGYGALMQFLADSSIKAGAKLILSAPVKEISWSKGTVTAITANGQSYTAAKIMLTVPVGVWQQGAAAMGAISFTPALPDHMAAFGKMGMGGVIKLMLQFRTMFWADREKEMASMMFIFSEEQVPTWWTQYPEKTGLLTGWLAGPKAVALQQKTSEELLELALASLSGIFHINPEALKEQLSTWHIANWSAIPYSCGGYSYVTTETAEALQTLQQPVADTLYFSGEGMYSGSAIGTVEAALVHARQTAEAIIRAGSAGE